MPNLGPRWRCYLHAPTDLSRGKSPRYRFHLGLDWRFWRREKSLDIVRKTLRKMIKAFLIDVTCIFYDSFIKKSEITALPR